MTKHFLRRSGILVLFLTAFCTGLLANSPGNNGIISSLFTPDSVTIGEATALTVEVKNMSDGKPNGSSRYSITIPDHILNADQTEVAEKNIANDLTESGANGNKTYDHGSYTSLIPGAYTFPLTVTTGDKAGGDPTVYFHPAAPADFAVSDITPLGFTLTWTAGQGADAYCIDITTATDTIIANHLTGTSYTIDTLRPETVYTCNIRSVGGGLFSLTSPAPVNTTTQVRPVITVDGTVQPFADFTLGVSQAQTQTVSVSGADLQEDITLALGTTAGAYTVTPDRIAADATATDITVTLAPTRAGTAKDTLTIASRYAQPIRIPLTANVIVQTPKALPATDEKGSSFTAHWEAVPAAEDYLLTVLDATGTPVEDYKQLSVGTVTEYRVGNLLPLSSYTYSVVAVNNGVQSAPSEAIRVQTLDGAVITYSKWTPLTLTVNESDSKTIRVSGNKLTDRITAELSDKTHFQIDKTELNKEGGSIVVTYAPTTVDTHEATLTLRSATAADVVITLQGKGLPAATTATAATAITDRGFTARWEAKEHAADYLLTVVQGDETVVADRPSEGATSLTVGDLTAGAGYTYTVKVLENGLASVPSNAVTVFTQGAPRPTVYPERKAIRTTWPAVVTADGYRVSLYEADSETPLEQYNGVATSATEYTFTQLKANTAYDVEVAALFGETVYSSGKIRTATTGHYGAQLRNNGFEEWDNPGAKEEEPAHWNSFMNAAGDQAGGIGAGFVKVQKVKSSGDFRPGSSGRTSAAIWSTSAFSIIANGNLTTGRIMANSMTAEDVSNHNITLPDNDAFNAPFTGNPDSLTVWVRFVPKNAGDMARVAAVIHDRYEYHDPNDKPETEAHAFSKAALDYPAAEGNAWQRLTVPFVATGNAVNPEYMLVSFTTNKTPGKGSELDSVYIDDMLMVYAPTVSIEKTDKSKYVSGESITVSYTLEGTMSPYNLNAEPNVVYLELSDADGSFDNARRIAQRTTDYSGELTARLSDDLELSSAYRVRIVTTNYPMTSAPSEPFALRRMPAAPVALEATDITAASFVAHWEAADGATGYTITVNGKEHIAEGGETTSLEIKGLTPETNYSYTVKTLADDLVSAPSNAISFRTASGGSMTATGNTTFATTVGMGVTETLAVESVGLISGITISLTDASGCFAIDTETLTPDGGTLTVTYRPETIGTHTAQLLLRSSFVDNVVVGLSGTCHPKAVATLEATDLTPVSFTARWESSDEADHYLLSVFNAEGTPLDAYKARPVNETALEINGLTPGASYSYDVQVSSADILSEVSERAQVTLPAQPVIRVTAPTETAIIDLGEEATFDIAVEANDLLSPDIRVTLLPRHGSTDFTADTETIRPGEELVVTYRPTEAGEDTLQVTFGSDHAETVSVYISGIARPLPVVALEASETAFESFTANWQANETADAYLLTVKDKRDRIVADYDRKDVGKATSFKVDQDLKRLNNYTYYVEVQANGVVSTPSNVITTRTAPDQSGVSSAETAAPRIYPNPAKDRLYVSGLPADAAYAIVSLQGLFITSGQAQGYKINVADLPAGMYILNISGRNLPFIKE